MGACDIFFTLDGSKNRQQVLEAFKRQQDLDRSDNGSRDGYSGDFQTVHEVAFYTQQVFSSHNEAKKYCLEHAEKWVNVIAVQYKSLGKDVADKKLDKLSAKLYAAKIAFAAASQKAVTAVLEAKSALVGCICGSKLARKALRDAICPVCSRTLLAPSVIAKQAKLQDKVREIEKQISDRRKELADKNGQLEWLVCGWGAC